MFLFFTNQSSIDPTLLLRKLTKKRKKQIACFVLFKKKPLSLYKQWPCLASLLTNQSDQYLSLFIASQSTLSSIPDLLNTNDFRVCSCHCILCFTIRLVLSHFCEPSIIKFKIFPLWKTLSKRETPWII